MIVEICASANLGAWVALRIALWPDGTEDEHLRDAGRILAEPDRFVVYLAKEEGDAIGFAEASIRHDFVNGCDSSPVVFLEGIYVRPEWRRRGVARALNNAVERWAASRSITELASDALLSNDVSHRMHASLGFEERERVVAFRKKLSA